MACYLKATNSDWSSVRSNDNHLVAILQEVPQSPVTKINLNIIYPKLHSNLIGPNDGTTVCCLEFQMLLRPVGPTWGPSGADRTQVGPMLATWTLLSGTILLHNPIQLKPGRNYTIRFQNDSIQFSSLCRYKRSQHTKNKQKNNTLKSTNISTEIINYLYQRDGHRTAAIHTVRKHYNKIAMIRWHGDHKPYNQSRLSLAERTYRWIPLFD